jgi:hypothetical protein
MHRLLLLAALLTGCPPPPRYAAFEVRSGAPLADAVVVAMCASHQAAAQRTDATGFARLPFGGRDFINPCIVTVAKPGYRTIETRGVAACSSPTGCPVRIIDIEGSR